jgi:hypothetical protein
MRTYTPLSKELHQTGEATDVCIGADYPHLQPKHIEQESKDGPLHIYKSIFGGGFILRGVEPGAAPAVPAAISADVATTAAAEVAAAKETIPEPKAALKMEVCVPEAAPAETEAGPSPVAAQEEPPQVEEVPEEKEAAPAGEDEDLPPTVASEAEEAAPAAMDEDLPPMAALENEAAPETTDASPPPTAALEDEEEEEGAAPATEEAAPTAADRGPPPRATPREETAPAAADKGLPPMAAPKDEADPEEATGRDEAGGQEADEDLPPATARGKHRPAFGFWTVVAMLAVTGMQCPDIASGFMARNCASSTNQMDVYSLRGPAARLTTIPHQPVMQAADVADRVGTEMECRVLHDDEEKGGGYPIAALEKLVEGRYPPFNPDFLAKNTDSQE